MITEREAAICIFSLHVSRKKRQHQFEKATQRHNYLATHLGAN